MTVCGLAKQLGQSFYGSWMAVTLMMAQLQINGMSHPRRLAPLLLLPLPLLFPIDQQ